MGPDGAAAWTPTRERAKPWGPATTLQVAAPSWRRCRQPLHNNHSPYFTAMPLSLPPACAAKALRRGVPARWRQRRIFKIIRKDSNRASVPDRRRVGADDMLAQLQTATL